MRMEPEKPMPLGTSYIIKTIRLLAIEDEVIRRACDALGGIEWAHLMQEATLFEAYRLGVFYGSRTAPRREACWRYLPERGSVATTVRTSVCLRVTTAELMSLAARHVEASETLFLIGSTLAYIGRLQRCYQAVRAASPRDSRKVLAALKRITLPSQYVYDSQ